MRVILAEDSTLLREGLSRLLAEEGHEVVGSFGDAITLLPAVAKTEPDIVVVDVRMPPTHTDEGLRAALRIRRDHPDVGVLILSQHVEKRFTVELLSGDINGVGYVLKDRVVRVEEFLDALERVGDGGSAFDPEVVRQLLSRTSHGDPLATLTDREREVLELMAEGHTNDAIAKRLFVSRSAVEKHVNAIFTKLELTANTDGYSRRVLAVLRYLDS
ncbi:response regulator transcription factor [Stackebrandtia nassauensis]|uniref:Two component transcriptional regulator, LuxR family n=1 Tax=Stackebrandtia nassauensis (strain DSM 44728 / CIP 108903 / NRRL B-16338 / NBRC 102104 / LLR-40K-21) TaxID=446470 RepID=D3Q3I6_STANL|nr:response regulator transcription factor [Stackebrandtia nassauensis]ADD42027.1 two component transcriptional regulator, LuxR family [Stackebrandtia nassauensis DSM 44728]